MSNKNNIPYNKSIYNFIISLGLSLYLTLPQLKHICEFIYAATQRDYDGKITHINEICFSSTHRTCMGKFLSKSPWNEDYILRALQKQTIEKIWTLSKTTGEPIYVIIDDTICKKSKPSSQAKNIIQNCSFHFSHLENKQVYGHQVIAVLLQCGDVTIPYQIKAYDKDIVDENGKTITKIQIAIDTINSLPKPPNKSYVLADSWYSAEKLIKAAIQKNFHYIGALKTNRVIYPKQFRMNHQIKGFAKTLNKEDFHLVTVNKSSYYVYRYEGKINGFEKVIVLISYPKEALFNKNALRAFITTDTELSTEEILNQYKNRWTIEVFFRQNKMNLGFDNYQIRSKKAIKRFMILTQLAYFYCIFGAKNDYCSFAEGVRIARTQSKKELIRWIYNQAKNGLTENEILKLLNLSLNKCA